MRVITMTAAVGIAAMLLFITGQPAEATQGITPGYDLEFSTFLQSQGQKVQPSVVIVQSRWTTFVTENGKKREIVIEGDFASGFIYNRDGIVVTDFGAIEHDYDRADYVMVKLVDGRTYEAEVIGVDPPTSIAVLKCKFLEPKDSIPAPLGNSNDVIVGEPILFLGYNWLTRSRISYNFGVVSALKPKFPTIEESTNQYFQINVPQNYGNQGGVVINTSGRVIATMTNIAPYPEATELHFALPVNKVIEVVDEILDKGKMYRPWLGFRILEMNPQIERAYSIITDMTGDGLVTDADRDLFAKETGIDLKKALFVIFVYEDSPAMDVGFREGDILMEFNGVPVRTTEELMDQIDRYKIGDVVTLEWMRREYAVWDPYIGNLKIEYYGQREDEKAEKTKVKTAEAQKR